MKHRQFTKVNADDSDVTDVDSDEEVLRRPQRCASGHERASELCAAMSKIVC